MDFGRILDEWERRTGPGGGESSGRSEEDVDDRRSRLEKAAERRRRLRKLEPQRQIDLHGLTVQQAVQRVDAFLKECRAGGLKKVLIVHGKGLHSRQGPVLQRAVREFVQKSPLAGDTGRAEKRWGGSGAMWVVLRD